MAEITQQAAGSARKPRVTGADISAGLTTALVTIPDGMATSLLAGVSPIHGLYALMVGTPVAALVMSSTFMFVANTGALGVATGSALGSLQGDQREQAVLMLTLLVGVIELIFGLLRLGGLMRFVSNAVLVGFMAGVAVNIILGQLGDFTGYKSEASNKVVQAFDLLLHLPQVHLPTLLIGLIALALMVLLERTPVAKFAMILALLGATAAVILLGWQNTVANIGDVAQIPQSLPRPQLPDLSLAPGLILPAVSLAIIGLVQASGVSKSVPNPDGSYSDLSRDFTGQGAGNIASGLFGGMPIGGAMSETAVNRKAGARTRWAIVFSGIFVAVVALALGDVVERFPMPSIAALLIFVGYEAIKPDQISDVWWAGLAPRLIMLFTFAATLLMPVQWAVLLGVALSAVQYVWSASLDIKLVEITRRPDGSLHEAPAPAQLPANAITILQIYGSPFYAGAHTLEGMLPAPAGAANAVVILRLRGRDAIGSTMIKVLEAYDNKLNAEGGKLLLTGVSEGVFDQLERTGTTEAIPHEDIFLATDTLAQSTEAAVAAASLWLQNKRTE